MKKHFQQDKEFIKGLEISFRSPKHRTIGRSECANRVQQSYKWNLSKANTKKRYLLKIRIEHTMFIF